MSRERHLFTQLFGLTTAILVGNCALATVAVGQTTSPERAVDCSAYASIPLPAEAEKASVPNTPPACASYRSYRGIGRPVNYSEARRVLPALAAEVIRSQVGIRHGVQVGVIAILHTFNGRLEFNSHVHTMVTGGGLHGSSNTWIPRVYFNQDRLMKAWRKAVIALLHAALLAGLLQRELTADQAEDLLAHLEKCWWSIKTQPFEDKWHFLQYAGRYVRRPPIAQRRITQERIQGLHAEPPQSGTRWYLCFTVAVSLKDFAYMGSVRPSKVRSGLGLTRYPIYVVGIERSMLRR